MLLGVLSGFIVPQRWQQGSVTKDGLWVELKDPAPAFAAAVQQANAQLQAAAYPPQV